MSDRRCHMGTGTLAGVGLLLTCLSFTATHGEDDAGPLRITTEWSAPDGALERQFGHTVALDAGLIAIATDRGENLDLTQGAVRLIRTDLGSPPKDQILTAPERAWPDRFGGSLALDGARLLVGAPQDSEHGWDAGAAWFHEYQAGTWTLTQRLQPDEVEQGSQFGAALSMHEDHVVIGAPRSDDGRDLDTGAAHVFRWTGTRWESRGVLRAPDRSEADFFGKSVALTDGWIAAGAWGDDDLGEKTGSVWLFRQDGDKWISFQKLVPADAIARDRYGWEVTFAGDRLLVSACGANATRGRVYSHSFDGHAWNIEQILEDPAGTRGNWFGYAIAARGDLVAIGSPGVDGATQLEGRVSVYKHIAGAWNLIGSVSSGTGEGAQPVQFGWSVATDGTRVLVGRIDDADGPSEPGRAWLVESVVDLDDGGIP